MPELLARISTHLLIPLLFAVWLGSSSRRSRWEWAIDAVLFWGYVVLVFLVGTWPTLAYGLRYVPPVALLTATFWGGRRLPRLPSRPASWRRSVLLIPLGLILVFGALQALVAQSPGLPAVPLEFPLRDGTYCATEGGRHAWVNRFAGSDSGRVVLEVARLDPRGRLDRRTPIEVYSPLAGSVVALRGDGVELGGRRVVDGVDAEIRLWLGPLEGDVAVGDSVGVGDRLGSVLPAASGVRALRIAARADGTPTPITFNGYYLARNDLFQAPRLRPRDVGPAGP